MSGKKPITIRKERFYPHPPEDVWVAITDPQALAEWMEPNNHLAEVGHKFEFMTDACTCGSLTECEVLESDPPRRLVWSWVKVPKKSGQPKPGPMTITWELFPEEGGTRLVLEQAGAENIGLGTRFMMRIGWGFMLKRMIPKVLGNVTEGRFTPGAIPLEKRYYKCRTVPEKYIR